MCSAAFQLDLGCAATKVNNGLAKTVKSASLPSFKGASWNSLLAASRSLPSSSVTGPVATSTSASPGTIFVGGGSGMAACTGALGGLAWVMCTVPLENFGALTLLLICDCASCGTAKFTNTAAAISVSTSRELENEKR